jgi:hypothetical protein
MQSKYSCCEFSILNTTNLFLGWPRLLFVVGLYDSIYHGKQLLSIRVIRLNQLSVFSDSVIETIHLKFFVIS